MTTTSWSATTAPTAARAPTPSWSKGPGAHYGEDQAEAELEAMLAGCALPPLDSLVKGRPAGAAREREGDARGSWAWGRRSAGRARRMGSAGCSGSHPTPCAAGFFARSPQGGARLVALHCRLQGGACFLATCEGPHTRSAQALKRTQVAPVREFHRRTASDRGAYPWHLRAGVAVGPPVH